MFLYHFGWRRLGGADSLIEALMMNSAGYDVPSVIAGG